MLRRVISRPRPQTLRGPQTRAWGCVTLRTSSSGGSSSGGVGAAPDDAAATAAAASTSPSSPSISALTSPTLALTAAEDKLFDFLCYIRHLYAPTTELRVAGGWVRDKLRGAESEDIDIVLDNLHGRAFANCITRFQRHRRLPQSSVGVVKANSDKSKHLEVAQVRIDGHTVDFVHLRAEAYADDASRVPTSAAFAPPHEDALRRDLTINALFYNLHTREVEDFTGRGLADLAAGRIATPLAPHQTFLDDPLRILRVLRFACDLGFALDPAIEAALRPAPTDDDDANNDDDQLRAAMVRKVSRERVGIELRKMLSGRDPARAFGLLADFGLLDAVFHGRAPTATAPTTATLDAESPASVLIAWSPAAIARSRAHVGFLQATRWAIDRHQLSFVESTAAILAPFALAPGHARGLREGLALTVAHAATALATVQNDNNDEQLLDVALGYQRYRDDRLATLPREDLVDLLKVNVKWPKPAARRVVTILEALRAFPALEPAALARNTLQLAMWGIRYRDVLNPALTTLLTECYDRDGHVDVESRQALVGALAESIGGLAEASAALTRRVDGQRIRQRLGSGAGPAIGQALEVLTVWELVHPEGTLDEELAFLDRLGTRLLQQ